MTIKRNYHFHDSQRGTALTIRVIPNAPKTEITSIMEDGTIKIKVAAPPVDGKANQVLMRYLANLLDISESHIEIMAGLKGRIKLVTINNISADDVNRRIQAALE